jgi:hypothetical protein
MREDKMREHVRTVHEKKGNKVKRELEIEDDEGEESEDEFDE